MLISLTWLKEYIELDDSVENISNNLTKIGIEVGAIEQPGKNLKNIYAAKIIEKEIIDNKLAVCKMDLGTKIDHTITALTTDLNVKINDIVPYALPGSVISNNITVQSKSFKNGLVSEGMMLSEQELGLADSAKGIWRINDNSILPGTDLIKELFLDDYILEIDITPNRSDCLSILGVARELSIIYNKEVKIPDTKIETENDLSSNEKIKINIIDEKGCSLYSGRYIENVTIKPSSALMQTRLFQSTLRPINNIVDVTNYVLLEIGQPLHSFDYDLLENSEIIVKFANEKDKFKTLDEQEHSLSNINLMICDGKQPVAVAGVMGGFNSEIKDNTERILLESAYFNPVVIRKSGRKLSLSTESSYRFERGVDYNSVILASNRATTLIKQLCPEAKISKDINIAESKKFKFKNKTVSIKTSKIYKTIGRDYSNEEITDYFNRLNFKILNSDENSYTLEIPSYRNDVEYDYDIVEEIARVSGYDNIPDLIPESVLTLGSRTNEQNKEIKTISFFVNQGMFETINFSFIDPDLINDFFYNLFDVKDIEFIELTNPLGKEVSVMQPSTLPNLIKNLIYNIKRKNQSLNFFNVSNIFYKQKEEICQRLNLGGIITKKLISNNFSAETIPPDFYYCKSILEKYFESLNIKNDIIFEQGKIDFLHPGQTAILKINDTKIGFLGKINPKSANKQNLPDHTFIFEINLDAIFEINNNLFYKSFSKFPYTFIDISMLVSNSISFNQIKQTINDLNIQSLENIEINSIYKGEQIPENTTSLSIRIFFRDENKTLSEEIVSDYHKTIFNELQNKLNIQPR